MTRSIQLKTANLLYVAPKRSFETLTIFELVNKERAREEASLSCITTDMSICKSY